MTHTIELYPEEFLKVVPVYLGVPVHARDDEFIPDGFHVAVCGKHYSLGGSAIRTRSKGLRCFLPLFDVDRGMLKPIPFPTRAEAEKALKSLKVVHKDTPADFEPPANVTAVIQAVKAEASKLAQQEIAA